MQIISYQINDNKLLLLFFSFSFWQFCTRFRHCLVLRAFLYSFLFYFSFAFLQSLIGWFCFFLFSSHFFFSFLFSWSTCITQGKRSFFWTIPLFSLPRVGLEIWILGQGLWPKSLRFGSKGIKVIPLNHFHDTHMTMMIRKFMQNWLQHTSIWTLKHNALWPCKH